MRGMRFLSIAGLLSACCLFSFAAYGASLPTLKVDSQLPLVISISEQGSSSLLSLPVDFIREIDGLYDVVYVEDISGGKVGEIVFRLEGSDVNSCARVLFYDKDKRSLVELAFKEGGLCNYKIQHGHVVSSYREGASWNEDIYRIKDGKAERVVSDICVGCREVRRMKYGNDGSVTRFLVSDNVDFEKRNPLTSKVSTLRARVFASPSSMQPTKRYLVRGDQVTLVGFDQSHDGQDWIEFRFSGDTTTTEGWLRCSDLESCAGN